MASGSRMPRWLPMGLAIAVGGALLALADRWLQPVPLPAGLATLAGAVVLGWPGAAARTGRVWACAALGLLLGVGAHLWVHLSGGSPAPGEGVPLHLGRDAARSAGVSAAALLGVGAVLRLVRRRAGPGAAAPPR